MLDLTLVSADYHRNGISGEGFWAIIFDDAENGRMVASLFADHDYFCAVYKVSELAAGNIDFARGNSWRGDYYEKPLRHLVDESRKDDKWHTKLVGRPVQRRREENDG